MQLPASFVWPCSAQTSQQPSQVADTSGQGLDVGAKGFGKLW